MNRISFREIVILLSIALIFVSCSSENDTVNRTSFEIDMTDSKLDSIIHTYIIECSVPVNQRLIVLRYFNDGAREFYYLTQSRRELFKEDAPDYYFLHRGQALVLLFLNGNKFFKSSEIVYELQYHLLEKGIEISNDSLDFNPPRWEIIKDCSQRLEIRRKQSNNLLDFLPCGYKIQQDSLDLSQYSVVKE